jgi:hypothetical protein
MLFLVTLFDYFKDFLKTWTGPIKFFTILINFCYCQFQPGNPHWRGGFSTVDLRVSTCLDHLLLIIPTLFSPLSISCELIWSCIMSNKCWKNFEFFSTFLKNGHFCTVVMWCHKFFFYKKNNNNQGKYRGLLFSDNGLNPKPHVKQPWVLKFLGRKTRKTIF